jgi:hypothetical protein
MLSSSSSVRRWKASSVLGNAGCGGPVGRGTRGASLSWRVAIFFVRAALLGRVRGAIFGGSGIGDEFGELEAGSWGGGGWVWLLCQRKADVSFVSEVLANSGEDQLLDGLWISIWVNWRRIVAAGIV